MTRTPVDPELRRAARRVPPLPIGNRLMRRLMRSAPGPRRAAGVDIRTWEVRDGHLKLLLYAPRERPASAALLWIHGGGFVIGNAAMDAAHNADVARLGITVVAVDYRLAPEHPFPAPLDDCLQAWLWIHQHADDLGVDPKRVALGGSSAGGGLAACLAQRLHACGHPEPAAMWLSAPMLDDCTAARRELDAVRHRIWSNRHNHIGWRSYLNAAPGTSTVPEFSVPARREDLSGSAPTWIGVGDLDLFHDEDLAYAERLRAAGADVTVDITPGAPHGFESWAFRADISRRYRERANAWLARSVQLADLE
ncbi:alpha/beta hydrolase [Streptomyces sp. NPDC091292]|uniref:alpha/beta hydrolase n=1 Tax=Streptomyces sp. NPDC091292 TaxID=3365991 RepID=UPI0037F4CBD1